MVYQARPGFPRLSRAKELAPVLLPLGCSRVSARRPSAWASLHSSKALVARLVSDQPATIARMKAVEFWYWKMLNHRGIVAMSPCRFTVEDALQRDPDAVRVPGSCAVRFLPVSPEEFDARCTSAFLKRPKC